MRQCVNEFLVAGFNQTPAARQGVERINKFSFLHVWLQIFFIFVVYVHGKTLYQAIQAGMMIICMFSMAIALNPLSRRSNMDKGKARIKDIAAMAGVSHGTVDRVIHDRGEVSETTKKRIQNIIEDLNYEPDLSARILASRKTYRLAVCIPDPRQDSSFWQSPILGIDKASNEIKHLGVIHRKFLFNQLDRASFKTCISRIIEYQPDGVILAPLFSGEADRLMKYCDTHQIPYVFINSRLEGNNNLTYIGQDDYQSGKVAGRLMHNCLSPEEELLIVHLAKSTDTYPHLVNRQKGLESCFTHKSKVHLLHIKSNQTPAIHRQLTTYLKQYPRIKGIFVTNSKAFKIARYLEQTRLPFYLIGYDLTEENLSHLEKDTITYLISQSPFDQGYMSIKSLLNALVLNQPIEKEYILPIEIIIKENMNHLNNANPL